MTLLAIIFRCVKHLKWKNKAACPLECHTVVLNGFHHTVKSHAFSKSITSVIATSCPGVTEARPPSMRPGPNGCARGACSQSRSL